MAKLTLEKTMNTSFIEMRDSSDIKGSIKAFQDYNRRIKLLGANGRLDMDSTNDISGIITKTARQLLSEKDDDGQKLYLPGHSAVVVEADGTIVGARSVANDIPYLNRCGDGLMWALLKVGQESFAYAHAHSSASLEAGYRAVSGALTGLPFDVIPFADRQHIGGSTVLKSLYPNSESMRKLEVVPVFAGVSGVVATPAFRDLAVAKSPEVLPIMHEAYSEPEILDGFEGNMFAGSIDSTLASFILTSVIASIPDGERPFTNHAVASILTRHAAGINIH
jgi:hypothetical protein